MKSTLTYLHTLKTFSAATIGAALTLTLSAQTPAVSAASDAPKQKPNIIVILADDYGWGSAGCYGAPAELKTPNLDRLASEGLRFTNAYAPSSVCSPTRFGLMTGRYDWRTRGDRGGVIGFYAPLQIETNRLTLASLCKDQGYRTAAFGKWHLGIGNPPRTDWNKPLEPGPRAIGFDYFYGIAANAWNGPHAFIENEALLDRIPGEEVKVMQNYSPTNYTKGLKEQYDTRLLMDKFTKKAKEWIGENSSEPFFVYYAATAVHKPHDYHPRFTGSTPFDKYGNFIEELDWTVGQILDQLDSLNLADNTLVIFTSDNGGVIKQRDPEIKYAMDAGLAINGPLRGGKHERV
jgi:arylsulfatase A